MKSHSKSRAVKQLSHQLSCVAVLAVLVAAARPAAAQVVTASVQGRVYDVTGAAIPEAKLVVVNTATGLSRSTLATPTGDYQVALLPVGEYTVTAEKEGFQKSAKKI